MIARLLSVSRLSSEFALEGVDDGPQLLEIYAPLLTRPKLANAAFNSERGVPPSPNMRSV